MAIPRFIAPQRVPIREIVFGAAAVAMTSLMLALPALDRFDGLTLDVLHWLRDRTTPQRFSATDSQAVVVAIDEETYATPPFSQGPKVTWTRELGTVLDGLRVAGARAVGLDVIFPSTMESFARGFDRDFRVALREAAKQNLVVLGKAQHSDTPILPERGQQIAVYGQKNIRATNLNEDPDGVIRSVPLTFDVVSPDGKALPEPSFSAELAVRSGAQSVRLDETGMLVSVHPLISKSGTNAIALNFDRLPEAIPTYSLADVYACLQQGKRDRMIELFEGKTVLIGAVLDVEDRKLTSSRLVGTRDGSNWPARCATTAPIRETYRRDTLPGVYVHATAVNNLVWGDLLDVPDRITQVLHALPLLVISAGFTLAFPIVAASVGTLAFAVVWLAIAVAAFGGNVVLPLIDPVAGGAFLFSVLAAYRFAIADRDKRQLRKSFSLYLAAPVVDRLVDQRERPQLGGETRELTVWFSDIASYSSLAEGLSPTDLVAFLNTYLSAMTDIVEENAGFVDKYIGDAIVAVFGAPLLEPIPHAISSVNTALQCQKKLAEMQGEFGLPGSPIVAARIGINSGEMLVGNIGSRKRFNYTVMGDAVNLAARLEGVNKVYGTSTLVSDRTVELCRGAFEFREIDRVRVVGRDTPVTIYEPLGESGTVDPGTQRLISTYSEALELFRGKRFGDAAEVFETIAETDAASVAFLERCVDYLADPPDEHWDGVIDMTSK